ncbi:MAG TPA: alanine racemase, partial [bacterium]|nr:alanine racemase [bacterium]
PENATQLARSVAAIEDVELMGFMTIPPYDEDPEKGRPFFRRLKAIRDDAAKKLGTRLPELSMGMSHDLEVAIEEGATIVRVGTAIFGEREKTSFPSS